MHLTERATLNCHRLIPDVTVDSTESTYSNHLDRIPHSDLPISTVVSLSSTGLPLRPLSSARRTHIMSILNVTPDSFSDGGDHFCPTSHASSIRAHLAAGATIIDIGGQSTRPHAPPVTAEEELSRVLPAIYATVAINKTLPPASRAAISIDTFRAPVARAAVAAGAHIVNDVSAGTLDADMLATVAELGCTVVLMHMRGDPDTMTSAEHTAYPDGVVETVARELAARVRAAERAGVRRWRMVLDPGIGFAKTGSQNLELLRRLGQLREAEGLCGLPWLVGTSRKAFIGNITGVKEARERSWGTAAAVAAAVQGGADVVRVHDVDEMSKVVRMADAIWRC